MNEFHDSPFAVGHEHVFLGQGHEKNERKTWAVIGLCSVMMVVEIVGGGIYGSLALVADGLHMSTHASAMLIAALAYTYARKHAQDRRFVFGTGKLGDLAGFTSAIILAMIALLIGYEAVVRFLAPVPIRFSEAIPIAVVGLGVNLVSAWLLSGDHDHGHEGHHGHHHHDHKHGPADVHHHAAEVRDIATAAGSLQLSIFEDGVPPVFRLASASGGVLPAPASVSATTIRPDGSRQVFQFAERAGFLQSVVPIPEPHAFEVTLRLPDGDHRTSFAEHPPGEESHTAGEHTVDHRDHNIRAAYIHVMADAAVSILAIVGLLLARAFGWLWMDPLAGVVGALVIANWSIGLARVTGAILLDINPSGSMEKRVRSAVDGAGDRLLDLHIWRLGPGHYGAVVSVVTAMAQRGPEFYHAILRPLQGLSHLTVEVHRTPATRASG